MIRFRFPLLVISVLALFALSGARPVLAGQVYGGWTHSDVGLQNKGDGLYLGVGNEIPMVSRVFDASYALEYVQKVGSQPVFFTDPITGFAVTDAEVTLHCLQPALFLGASVPDLGFVPRVYVGTSIVLKVAESWSEFPGQPVIEWGYKNTDIVGHVGVSLGVGPVTADFRFSQGFTGQLLHDNTPQPQGDKAESPPEGNHVPQIGAKVHNYQLGVGITF